MKIRKNNSSGFTLIELLVVVLIIGILAAVALPQYQKAVERSKATQALTMLKSVYQAAEEYYMVNGSWPTSFADLSITPSWTGKTKWYTQDNVTVDVLSDNDWSLLLINTNSNLDGINIGRLSGKYTGGGFLIFTQYPSVDLPLNTIMCVEKKSDIETGGDYCQKIMQSTTYLTEQSILRYYKMP